MVLRHKFNVVGHKFNVVGHESLLQMKTKATFKRMSAQAQDPAKT